MSNKISNKESAELMVKAIRALAGNEFALENLEHYLEKHFDVWMQKFGTPEDIACELYLFSTITE